jgi:hypothetical protein
VKKLSIIVFWVVVAGFFFYKLSQLHQNEQKNGVEGAIVMQGESPEEKAPQPILKIENYRIENEGFAAFYIKYELVNEGQGVAENVEVILKPWKEAAIKNTDNEAHLSASNYRSKITQVDLFPTINPGQKISRSHRFAHFYDLEPYAGSTYAEIHIRPPAVKP